jgi:hypothetical protein
VTYSFTAATQQVSNLGHLEGKEVVAVADRVLVTGLIVEGGRVMLPDPALRVTVGLPYVSTVETLPLAIQTSKGWSLAQPQQVSKVALRVIESRGVYSGPTDDKLSEAKPRTNEPSGLRQASGRGCSKRSFSRTSGPETGAIRASPSSSSRLIRCRSR